MTNESKPFFQNRNSGKLNQSRRPFPVVWHSARDNVSKTADIIIARPLLYPFDTLLPLF